MKFQERDMDKDIKVYDNSQVNGHHLERMRDEFR